MNAVSIIANVWFGDKERTVATALAGLAGPLGNMSSLIISGIAIAGYTEADLQDDLKNGGDDLRSRVKSILIVQNSIVSFFCILFFFLVKEKPEHPASKSSLEKPADIKMGKEMRNLLKDKNYVFVLIIFTILYGIYTTLGNILSPLFSPYGYTGA